MNIICLSNQLWDFPIWTNKRHVMTRMSAMGHKVLFVDPPINTGRVFLRQIARKYWPFSRILSQTKQEGNTLVYTPLNVLPSNSILSWLHVQRIRALAKKYFGNDKVVLWVYHVEIHNLQMYLEGLSYDTLVYDCVDNYVAFPRYKSEDQKNKIIDTEKDLARKSDIIFTTAPGLFERMRKYNQYTYYTPNVGDYEKFKDVKKTKYNVPKDLKDIPRPIIGFAGALDDYKFDADLVKKCAVESPGYSFVLIGPLGLKDMKASLKSIGLDNLKNVYYLGMREFDEIPKYYAGFDAYMIPTPLSDYTVGGCFPVKFHEALAVGLPTIVTDLPAYAPFENVCYISKNYDEFCANIKKGLEEDNAGKLRDRQNVARENSWDNKVKFMLGVVL